jgi:Protein of unknown function (DUF1615)
MLKSDSRHLDTCMPLIFKLRLRITLLALLITALAACDQSEPEPTPEQTKALITRLLPAKLADKKDWAADIYTAFNTQKIRRLPANICATLAVIEQESSYQANPAVPGLAKISRNEIDRRAAEHHIPLFLVRVALQVKSPNGETYEQRLEAVKTEKDLDQIFGEMIQAVPMGRQLLGGANPVHTGGPMQVSIAFAEDYAKVRRYPYGDSQSIRQEVFTRRGGLYFGIAHLLDYKTSYPSLKYRFADYNAGFYASRNAAFQQAVTKASGIALDYDGDLIHHQKRSKQLGATEAAVLSLADKLAMSQAQIQQDLKRSQSFQFESTLLYERMFALAEQKTGKTLARAIMPKIKLDSPKITRKLTTEWFANRVDERYQRCMVKVRG